MPLEPRNMRTFHRALYGKILESVTLLKRGDNQQQGTVTSYRLHQIRWSRVYKAGNTIQGDMNAEHYRQIHIPRIELDRIGIAYINPTDRFIDKDGRYWHPEANEQIVVQLCEQHVCVNCRRVDPPRAA